MSTMEKLKRSAEQACRWRGHEMGEWSEGEIRAIAECAHCGKEAHVDTKPAPNGIDVAGEAVALGCAD